MKWCHSLAFLINFKFSWKWNQFLDILYIFGDIYQYLVHIVINNSSILMNMHQGKNIKISLLFLNEIFSFYCYKNSGYCMGKFLAVP